jgi:drug/metabolite transporter (DMT)-like permease
LRFAGELAALGTALCWSMGSNLLAAAGRRVGAMDMNRIRISAATILLASTLLVVRGSPWPHWASARDVALLALSGLIGFVFGDTFQFRSIVIMGPGRAGLMASTAPIFTALMAWPALGERLRPLALLGMALTVGGILWVMYERGHDSPERRHGSMIAGVAFGLLGALGQAGGYVISKLALRSGLDPLSATVVRIAAAAIGIWVIAAFQGDGARSLEALRDRRSGLFLLGAAVCGPFLGVTLSLLALEFVEAGVAASIIAFSPVFTILIAARFHREPLTARKIAGALIAVAGVVVLFMR